MGKVDIWMPIFIGDYLRDTSELTGPEHGAYFLLLMHYWQKRGEIGNDVERLALVCRSEAKTCRFVLERFFTLKDGNYKNKRADEELLAAQNRSDTARTNVNKRWNKDSNAPVIPPYKDGSTDDNTESIPNGYSSSPPSSLPIPIQSEKKENTGARFARPTIVDIKAYCNLKGIKIDPQEFFDYYESNGWKVGKNPMKDWMATVRRWGRHEKAKPKESSCSIPLFVPDPAMQALVDREYQEQGGENGNA